jgi:PDZ domain-containing protein
VTDTQPPTVPPDHEPIGLVAPDPDAVVPGRAETEAEAAARADLTVAGGGRRAAMVSVVVLAWLVLIAVAVTAVLPSAWFVEAPNRRLGVDQPAGYARTPASAQAVDERVTFAGLEGKATRYASAGDFYFVTVMAPEQSLLSWLVGYGYPAVEFVTREDVFGFRSPSQRRTLDLASMRTSEQVAQYVALRRVGYDVELVNGDVLIEDIVCLEIAPDGSSDDDGCLTWSPSDAVLDPGDKIVEVDGVAVATVEDLSRELEGRSPGDIVPMVIERPDRGRLTVDVELTASPDDPDRTIVGFFPFDTARVVLPFEVAIDTQAVGGPSAGLAFTLTLIDELTEGELTGGIDVAVTGTIDLDGKVGAIGGLRQKASAVAQAGVDVFLVPAAQGEQDIAAARRVGADRVRIIPVGTLDEALAELAALGGDPIPPPSAALPAE